MKVIITGMHRSGTSMIAGLLRICGLYLGSNLISGLKDNPKGHFEDRGFVQLNDEILGSNGGTWDKPPPVIHMPSPHFFKKMKMFVAQWPKNRPVGWKDPRACLTLKLWKEAIDPEELRVVIVNRPHEEISASLRARNRMTQHRATALTFFYLKHIMENVGHLRVKWKATHSNQYLTHWYKELKSIANLAGLSIPEDRTEIEEFIDENLWHHRSEQ